MMTFWVAIPNKSPSNPKATPRQSLGNHWATPQESLRIPFTMAIALQSLGRPLATDLEPLHPKAILWQSPGRP